MSKASYWLNTAKGWRFKNKQLEGWDIQVDLKFESIRIKVWGCEHAFYGFEELLSASKDDQMH